MRLLAGMVMTLALATTPAPAQVRGDESVFAGTPTLLRWEDLMPEGEEDRLEEMFMSLAAAAAAIDEGDVDDRMTQVGTLEVVEDLDGEYIRLPGYLMPLDYLAGGASKRFLLVPYYGACIHVPPPPPNQMVYLEADEPMTMDDMWTPFWVEGVLSTEAQDHDYGAAAYSLSLKRLEIYE